MSLKNKIIRFLHFAFGYDNYLKSFTIFKILSLNFDKRKSDFLFFNRQLKPDDRIIVIGACTGITTIPLAKGFPKRTVFAYEPLLSNYNVLVKAIFIYRLTNILTFNIGLGNRCEERDFILPMVKGVKKQGLAHVVDKTITDYNEGLIEKVKIDILDQREELKNVRISAMKVVAENFEPYIFEGARNIILKNKPLIYCELWENHNRENVFSIIKSLGYSVYYRTGDNLLLFDDKAYLGKNFFFKPINV